MKFSLLLYPGFVAILEVGQTAAQGDLALLQGRRCGLSRPRIPLPACPGNAFPPQRDANTTGREADQPFFTSATGKHRNISPTLK